MSKCTKEKICSGYPVDFRLVLTDFSIEEIMDIENTSHKYRKINIKNFFNPILFIFGIHTILLKKNSIINFLKDIFLNFINSRFYK